jgi:hypothetical protein
MNTVNTINIEEMLNGTAIFVQKGKYHLQFAKNVDIRFANLVIRLNTKMFAKLLLGN